MVAAPGSFTIDYATPVVAELSVEADGRMMVRRELAAGDRGSVTLEALPAGLTPIVISAVALGRVSQALALHDQLGKRLGVPLNLLIPPANTQV